MLTQSSQSCQNWRDASDFQETPWRRNRLVSLYDMILFPVGIFHYLLELLEKYALKSEPPLSLTEQKLTSLNNLLNLVEKRCREIELGPEFVDSASPIDRVNRIRLALRTGWSPFDPEVYLARELRVLKEVIEDSLKFRYFLFLPSDKFKFWEQPERWFGSTVWAEFETAREDMKRAVDAYATDDFTGCVFHLMRVTERGLRRLAKHLRVDLRGRHIEYEDWGNLLKALDKKLAMLEQKRRGPKRAARVNFYSGAKDKCAYFNNLYRQEVSHARKGYDQNEALGALGQVRDFMQTLVQGLSRSKR